MGSGQAQAIWTQLAPLETPIKGCVQNSIHSNVDTCANKMCMGHIFSSLHWSCTQQVNVHLRFPCPLMLYIYFPTFVLISVSSCTSSMPPPCHAIPTIDCMCLWHALWAGGSSPELPVSKECKGQASHRHQHEKPHDLQYRSWYGFRSSTNERCNAPGRGQSTVRTRSVRVQAGASELSEPRSSNLRLPQREEAI